MKNHEGCRRAFHHSSKSWYGIHLKKPPTVHFGMYHSDGSTSGEMAMEWTELPGAWVPELRVFDDGWNALSLFPDLIERLGDLDDENISDDDFVNLLLELGFEDITEYEDPHKKKTPPDVEMITITIPKAKAEKLGLVT